MKIYCAALVAALALLLAGCGGGSGNEEPAAHHVHLTHLALDATPGSETVALVMANRSGFFREAGFTVLLGKPFSLTNAFSYLGAGQVDLIVAPAAQVILAGSSSLRVIRSLVKRPTEALIWLKDSGIDGIADLKGKTIAIPGLGFQENFLSLVLARAGLELSDVKVESLPYESAAALASGKVDAIFGGSWNVEGVELREQGLRPKIAPLQSFGVPPFEQAVLIGDPFNLPGRATLVRFMGAINRGAAAAIEHPAAAARALAEEYKEPKENAVKWRPGLEATLPLLSRSGHMDVEQAERLNDWMYGHEQFEIELPATEAFTNRYLEAGDGS